MRLGGSCLPLVALLLAAAIGVVPGVDPAAAPAPTPAGLAAYLDGLEALRQARWADATSAFARALQAAGDDPTFVLARGVALTLGEQFPQALADLGRADRLGLKGREAKLWIYAAEAMSGQVSPEHRIGGGGPRSLQRTPEAQRLGSVVSVPGHVMQGGQDYSTAYGSFIINEMAMPYQTARTEGGSVQALPIRRALAEAGARGPRTGPAATPCPFPPCPGSSRKEGRLTKRGPWPRTLSAATWQASSRMASRYPKSPRCCTRRSGSPFPRD